MLETRPERCVQGRWLTAMALVGVALLTGCADASDDVDDDAEASEPVPDDVADADDPAADEGGGSAGDDGGSTDRGGPPDLAGLEAAAIELFEATARICADHADAVGNTPIDPQHFVGAEVLVVRTGDPDVVVIQDGVGVELFVVPDRDEVWGGPDPDAVMPGPYSFGCPPEVYVGPADH